jgi:hypothetical protein
MKKEKKLSVNLKCPAEGASTSGKAILEKRKAGRICEG